MSYKTPKWNYCGDVNLEYGGYYWREDGADDYVLVVRVIPCSDAGGPDNMFWIEQGSLYIPTDKPEEIKRALDCCGWANDTPDRAMIVDALIAYRGIDPDCYNGQLAVRFGPEVESREEIKADVVMRSNASLARYVKREYLRS